ncbi:uncharacterized protein C5orf34 homolog [Anguilla rostrata]|uniref:uncharacterized protein C5orf34 homolog n=1 Tax=Anguilla rostrata TaxID=7938 RepID=UPI0030D25CA6
MVVVSMMVMYEDDSVEVRYGDGSCLQLSPCGSEFLLEKTVPPSAHPLLPSEKVRQRTRFVTSAHRELIVQALEFRNRFAARPYLPKELIPVDCRMHYFTDISEIEWPSSSSCGLEFGSNGEVIVSSVDGNASLLLSSSGEEFSAEFLCRTSQPEVPRPVSQDPELKPGSQRVEAQDRSAAGVLRSQQTTGGAAGGSGAKEKGQKSPLSLPGEEHLYTRVVQLHSCACPPPFWRYPLSLALGLWDAQQGGPGVQAGAEGAGAERMVGATAGPGGAEGAPGRSAAESRSRGERSHLPEALPLTCPTPHQHRWNFRDSTQRSEEDLEQGLRTELVKVLWRQGIVYRLISGAVAIMEVSPGDGSVIRSNGAVANYFTHYTARLAFGQNEEKRYCVNSLPPDVPGQAYSVSSVVTRANRILKCYNQARVSLKLPDTHCCWRQESSSADSSVLIREARVAGSGLFRAFSDGRVHVTFLDGVTLQMLWSFNTSTPAQGADGTLAPPSGLRQPCGWCQLILPDGHRQLLQVQTPGPYSRYVSAAVQWSRWVEGEAALTNQEARGEVPPSNPGLGWSVVAELEKIKRFNFLLEHSGLLKAPGGSTGSPGSSCGFQEVTSQGNPGTDSAVVNENSIAEALQRTSKAIQDIETLLSVRESTNHNTT